jgi:hypothetical protein
VGDAIARYVGLPRGVFPAVFPSLDAAFHIQNIVDDLKRQAGFDP